MERGIQVKIVGGGIAGLAAACHAARAGARVELFESATRLGGRAATREEQGFRFNMGPHALYRRASASRILDELDVRISGQAPPLSGSLASFEGRLHALPGGFVSLVTTGLLSLPEKLETGNLLARLPRLDASAFDGRCVADVLESEVRHERVRLLLAALIRLSTYGNAPELLSGGAALAQLQLALGGVRYLDGGWQTLVDALRAAAEQAGVRIRAATRVRAVEAGEGVTGLRLADDRRVDADRVVLALGPREASALLDAGGDPVLRRYAECLVPVRAASLDLGLRRLPVPRRRFALGIDEPTYFSVHTPYAADLAPEGGAVLHVARYLAPDEKPERPRLQAEFESILDAMQPGWRDAVASQKLLTDLRVSHAIPTAAMGGLAGRPPVRVEHRLGLFLAGDWVGPEGMLADASLASGRAAGRMAAGVDTGGVAA